MNVLALTQAMIVIVLIDLTIVIGHVAASYEPLGSKPPQHHPILKCPDCHLVKQPPDECGEFTHTAWLWIECQDLVHRYPDEKGQL